MKDYVLKQDLKKDFTEYKHEADRKEMLRDFYYSLVEDPGKLEFASCFVVIRSISKQRDHNHCLLCHMPSDLITYTVSAMLLVKSRTLVFSASSSTSREPYTATTSRLRCVSCSIVGERARSTSARSSAASSTRAWPDCFPSC